MPSFNRPIYLDYAATTPVDPRVVQAMVPWLAEHFGNPASNTHAWGWEAEEAVEQAIVEMLGPKRIGTLLDLGTGTGRILEVLGPRAGRAIGIDTTEFEVRPVPGKLARAA